MIEPLQTLRFIFAIFIFIHHFPFNGYQWEVGGVAGVSFFLILSGFVMSLGYAQKVIVPEFDYAKFIKKRLIRIYPLHIICLVLFIFFFGLTLTRNQLIALIPNTLLIQSWFPIKTIYFSGNAVSWCLSDMLFFYTVFPGLIRIQHKFPKISLLIFISIIIFYIIGLQFVPYNKAHFYIYILPLSRLIDFSIGIFLYKYISVIFTNNVLTKISYTLKTIIEICAFILLILFFYIYKHIDIQYTYSSLFWIPSIILIGVFATFKGGVSKIFSNQYLVNCGKWSFTFYMVHLLVINILEHILNTINLHLDTIYKFPIYLISAILISIFVYQKIELPITSKISQYI